MVDLALAAAGAASVSAPQGLDEQASVATSADGSVGVLLSGELYGSDVVGSFASHVLARYEAAGAGSLECLEGSFVGLVADGPRREIVAVSDHCGSRPLYYTEQGGHLLMAPGLHLLGRMVLRVSGRPPSVHPDAVVSFLLHGHLLGDQAWFEGVTSLRPGTVLRFDADGCPRSSRYFRLGPRPGPPRAAGIPELRREFAGLLRSAVGKRLGGGDLVLPLSGGIDSRGVLGCLLEADVGPIRTVSWGIDEEQVDADAGVARHLSDRYGSRHTFLERTASSLPDEIDEMTARIDGLTDDPAMHHHELSLMRRIRDELNGRSLLRGDECFGFGGPAASDVEAFARVGITRLAHRPDVRRLIPAADVEDRMEASTAMVDRIASECPLQDYTDRKDSYYASQRLVHYLNRSSYYKQTVLNLRNPWLDRSILDFVWHLPAEHRVDKRLFVDTLAWMFPRLMSEPVATRHSLEDWGNLLRSDERLANFVRDRVVREAETYSPWLDPQAVRGAAGRLLAGPSGDVRPGVTEIARNAARRLLPSGVRSLLKAHVGDAALSRPLPPGVLVMRLLVLGSWLRRVRGLEPL